MKVLASSGKNRFMVKSHNKFYIVALRSKKVMKLEDPEAIYRQGYWEAFKGKLDKSTEEAINDLLNSKGE